MKVRNILLEQICSQVTISYSNHQGMACIFQIESKLACSFCLISDKVGYKHQFPIRSLMPNKKGQKKQKKENKLKQKGFIECFWSFLDLHFWLVGQSPEDGFQLGCPNLNLYWLFRELTLGGLSWVEVLSCLFIKTIFW